MDKDIKKRLMRTVRLSAIALAVGAGLAMYQIQNEKSASVVQKASTATTMPGIKIGGDFVLIDHNGAAVTQANYAGDYKLIYFGFTYCPAICPTELQKITQVLKILGDDAQAIQPIFITVDPERDTVETMNGYVELFDPRLVGLTGSRAQIDATLKNYRVFASKVPNPDSNDADDYTMDHSSYIYLMSPEDELLSMYRIQDNADYIVNDIRGKLGQS